MNKTSRLGKKQSQSILDTIKPRGSDRRKISLYLSEGLYKEFRETCGDKPASQVLEILMKKFIDTEARIRQ